ncbi:MAG: 4'-phosphopantetheinyl transferase superfamily protein [Kiritimatiellae bacterium]|nr:4'-phosphopantetheinyl transferase superfamily protein [Kiritimatiellia bacterium]
MKKRPYSLTWCDVRALDEAEARRWLAEGGAMRRAEAEKMRWSARLAEAAGAARLLREAFGAACEREERDGRGKPRIPGAAAYSVSHSGGWVALAVAGEGVERIGVDIEARALRRRALPEALVRKTMDETEAAAVWASPDPWAEFLRRWVEKEAYVKATGEGVSGGLKDAMHRMASAEGWRVAPAEAPAGVFAAVAWEARGAE